MLMEGASLLGKNVKKVDALNVFPVPDGDTGTNMNLTMTSGIEEINTQPQEHAGTVAKYFSRGLLMGARGNSGVILSQLFRGFAKAVEKEKELTTYHLKKALEEGVSTAYKAVMKPVEGTILTVAKEAAQGAKKSSHAVPPEEWMAEVVAKAEQALKKTPDLLPVLKEVGVVDSGGQGLVYIYQGMLQALEGKFTEQNEQEASPSLEDLVKVEHHQNAHAQLSTEDIEFGYCTEVMVKFEEEKLRTHTFEESSFREELAKLGDSLLVVSDDDLLKVHIHAEYPGEVLSKAQAYGSLTHVKIENMREQHQALIRNESSESQGYTTYKPMEDGSSDEEDKDASPTQEYGFVTVSMGKGIEELFKGLNADEVIAGGQTMNPSTEDIVKAIAKVHARHIFVLPNNGNIVMAAEQAAQVSGYHVHIIPTTSVPQGLSALFAFNETAGLDENEQAMNEARKQVKTGQLTYAVRDTVIEGLEIKEGDYMGIAEKEIVTSGTDLQKTAEGLLEKLIDEQTEIVTLLRGEEADEDTEHTIITFIETHYEDVEVEVHEGGQPLYPFIISVE
ncbi:DAK2 domain-containing protein [Bacillus piscicola]|uniref:DAK2 domain-containing protein n=1 Tax=Bacillus piscicola TaxID=1632684 RepID=UPI0023DD6962|nr:DAK2 domain-containing protein [Bacillus piscicola]